MRMHVVVVVVVLEVEAYYFDCSYFDYFAYFDYCYLRDVVVLVVIVVVAVWWCWWWSEVVGVTGRGVGWERVGYRQSWKHVDCC